MNASMIPFEVVDVFSISNGFQTVPLWPTLTASFFFISNNLECIWGCDLLRCLCRVEVVFPSFFCWILPYLFPKEEKAIFYIIHCKRSIILWFFSLLKYTPWHILDSFISRIKFLESLVVNFNVTLNRHNFFISIHCSYLLHRHYTILTVVNSARRNIPLYIM